MHATSILRQDPLSFSPRRGLDDDAIAPARIARIDVTSPFPNRARNKRRSRGSTKLRLDRPSIERQRVSTRYPALSEQSLPLVAAFTPTCPTALEASSFIGRPVRPGRPDARPSSSLSGRSLRRLSMESCRPLEFITDSQCFPFSTLPIGDRCRGGLGRHREGELPFSTRRGYSNARVTSRATP